MMVFVFDNKENKEYLVSTRVSWSIHCYVTLIRNEIMHIVICDVWYIANPQYHRIAFGLNTNLSHSVLQTD